MSTVAQLIDRVFRDYLYQADDQPVRVRLGAAMADAATTSMNLDLTLIPLDARDAIAPGMILEVDREQVMVISGPAGAVWTVQRGVNGTTAIAHANGALVQVAPAFTRQTVFDAVADNIAVLYPKLWNTKTVAATTASPLTEIPAEALGGLVFRATATQPYSVPARLVDDWTPSSTGKAAVIDIAAGVAGLLTYRTGFARPTTEATDVTAAGVRAEWERIVVVGTAAQILSGRDVEVATQDFVTEALQAQTMPAGTEGRIASRLTALHELWLNDASRRLSAEETKRIRRVPVRRASL